jgi:hypothetical protein
VQAFLNQVAPERFWDQQGAARLALGLRVTLAPGEGVPEVREALGGRISWTR